MIKKFDAWIEPWIPVERYDGSIVNVSIYKVLKESHNLLAIRASTVTETFGIYRLLITILTDIYRPKRWFNIDNVRDEGRFNEEHLDRYYHECLTEDATFNLFDKERPFLQYAFTNSEKSSIKPASNIFDHLPSGNNIPHFLHNAEDSYSFSPARCLQALCAIPFYEKHKRAKKVTTGINGSPPVYFLYNGNTLFETLTVSMVPESLYKENGFGLPIWREKDCFLRKAIILPELLHGLFSAPLKVKLIPRDDNMIREIEIIDDGLDYSSEQWRDPHVAYTKDKDNRIRSLKAREMRSIWRDLPIIIEPNALRFLTNWTSRGISNEVTAFVKLTKLKATIFTPESQFIEELRIPLELLSNELRRTNYAKAILLSDDISKKCGKELEKPLKSSKKQNPYAQVLSTIFISSFLSQMKEVFDFSLIKLLENTDTDTVDWEIDINMFLEKEFRDAVSLSLTIALEKISDENVDALILKNKLKKAVFKSLNTLLKKGGYINDKHNRKL